MSGVLDALTIKEFQGVARRAQTYAARVLYTGFIGLVVYQYWKNLVARTPYLNASEFAFLGRELFNIFVPLQMSLVSLAAIASSADRVLREARAGTLGLLLLTPLTPKTIALAKWKAALAQSGSLILCGVPVMAVCVYLGGVGPLDLAFSFSLTLAMAALGSAFGIRASAIYSTTARAVLMGVLYTIGYALLPLALLFMGGWPAVFVTPFVHPVYAAFAAMVTDKGGGGDFMGGIMTLAWIPATIVSFVVAWFLVRAAGRHVERRAVMTPEAPPMVVDVGSVGPRPRWWKMSRKESSALQREVWEDDPLLWKEMITRAGARWSAETRRLFMIYASLFVILCWIFSRGMSPGTFSFLGSLFVVLTMAAGASLFAPDKEARKIEMLLSAPVSSGAIVRSKLLSGLLGSESLAVAALAAVTALGFSWWAGPVGIAVTGAVFFLFLAFTYVLSAAASLRARTMPGAFVASAGVLCLILLVLPVVVTLLADPSAAKDDLSLPLKLAASLNPLWVLAPLGDGNGDGPRSGAALGRLLLFAAAYGAAIAALLGSLFARFDRAIGRA